MKASQFIVFVIVVIFFSCETEPTYYKLNESQLIGRWQLLDYLEETVEIEDSVKDRTIYTHYNDLPSEIRNAIYQVRLVEHDVIRLDINDDIAKNYGRWSIDEEYIYVNTFKDNDMFNCKEYRVEQYKKKRLKLREHVGTEWYDRYYVNYNKYYIFRKVE